ncbi:hypothetical protein GNE08_05485 [Trichormus variabilis ARAD]|uniref:Uncharacterized protein n=1 Tax=Trichormus variabilis N2B TaxID=2681315 RepID=A0ABR6SHN8_ANAVA|nr:MULTISPECIES: hypothetical protein [Nostocaceae]MBC1213672.1 hypothetical protein [Trichormus variabilis ARAD]MBC1270860.1 hypothetical protein [Trichormus variabilis FSR]MBC1305778.1 hypothetical protein [Trichormus variabilis N2B]MBC1314789.1 hypothetical protein [Trichormus variabilis PNB]MBC1329706.1 hypothetical protein [Trichormus variabilis 9RC]
MQLPLKAAFNYLSLEVPLFQEKAFNYLNFEESVFREKAFNYLKAFKEYKRAKKPKILTV